MNLKISPPLPSTVQFYFIQFILLFPGPADNWIREQITLHRINREGSIIWFKLNHLIFSYFYSICSFYSCCTKLTDNEKSALFQKISDAISILY